MISSFFVHVFYIPLYNGLVFLINVLPGKNAGLAVILLTVIIRLVLYPLTKKSIVTQLEMKRIEPEMQAIKEKVKDKNEQAKQTMALYKQNNINPFAGLLLVIIQLPILISLYQVFRSGLPKINEAIIYYFIQTPGHISMMFLGADLVQKSIIIALFAAVTQFIQISISLPKPKKPTTRSFQSDLASSMNFQMKIVMPIMIFFIATLSSVVAIYLSTTNILMIAQEYFVRRRLVKAHEQKKIKIA